MSFSADIHATARDGWGAESSERKAVQQLEFVARLHEVELTRVG